MYNTQSYRQKEKTTTAPVWPEAETEGMVLDRRMPRVASGKFPWDPCGLSMGFLREVPRGLEVGSIPSREFRRRRGIHVRDLCGNALWTSWSVFFDSVVEPRPINLSGAQVQNSHLLLSASQTQV